MIKHNTFSRRAAVGILSSVLLLGMMPTSAFAATYTRSTELAVPVTHTLEGDTPADKLAFEFSITPVEEGDPVPAASTITVENPGGTLEDSFDAITYTKPGDYDYILSQVEGDTEGVTYDNSQYYVRVSVRYDQGELKPWVKGYKIDTSSAGSYAANADDADGKVAAFVFRNTYTEPKSEEPTTPEEPVTPDEPTESEAPETPAVSEVPTTSTVEPTTSTVESTTTETTVKKATSVSAVTTKTTTTTSTVPETGDNTHLTLLITLSLISCVIVIIGLGWILPRQKKH